MTAAQPGKLGLGGGEGNASRRASVDGRLQIRPRFILHNFQQLKRSKVEMQLTKAFPIRSFRHRDFEAPWIETSEVKVDNRTRPFFSVNIRGG